MIIARLADDAFGLYMGVLASGRRRIRVPSIVFFIGAINL